MFFRNRKQAAKPRSNARKGFSFDWLELETRVVLSQMHTNFVLAGGGLVPAQSSSPSGVTPAQMQQAYGASAVMFGSVTGDGTGQTIAIVDAYNQPNIASDLAAFDAYYGLPAPPSFTVVNQNGATAPLPGDASLGVWGVEISLDVEWSHVIAPQANILLVEANYADDNLFTAVDTARNYSGVSAVSMSWAEAEFAGDSSYDYHFTTPSGHNGVTFLAASGDSGAYAAGSQNVIVMYPAASPNVVGVGGTTLNVDSQGNYISESGWGYGTNSNWAGGSGGGISIYANQPSFQNGIVTQSTTQRTVPDVSMDADPNSGVPVYDSYDFGSGTPWDTVGGTSLATPMYAGVIAIADQGRALNGLGTLDGPSQTLPYLYTISASDMHDVTTGNNYYAAGPGYDLVTGLGTPIVNLLANDLASDTLTPTTTTLADNGPNPSTAGQSVSFTVTVSPAVPDGEAITLEDASNGNSVVGSGTLTSGSATINISSLSVGTHDIFAVYGGDTTYARCQSSQAVQVVNFVTTTMVSTDQAGPYTTNSSLTFTATITGSPNVGTVTFYAGAGQTNQIGSPIAVVNGTADSTTGQTFPAGSNTVTAVYSGGTGFTGSQGTCTIQVTSAPPSISNVVINQDISALYYAAGQPFPGAQRSMVEDIVYTFSEAVNILSPSTDPNVFTIAVASGWTGTVPTTIEWAPLAGSGNTQWEVDFGVNSNASGSQAGALASIANGAYTITVTDPGSITAVSDSQALSLASNGIGGATQSFFRLFGDINGDEFVNAYDNAMFKAALTTYNAAFDYAQNGFVNAADNAKFKADLAVNFSGFTPTI